MKDNWAVIGVETKVNKKFIKTAEKLKPVLITSEIRPEKIFIVDSDQMRESRIQLVSLGELELGRENGIILDFGEHRVGYLSFQCVLAGSPQDAPAMIKIKFCEIKKELWEDSSTYQGDLSRGWIQEEQFHIYQLPFKIEMKRRYAFRYVRIDIIDTSKKFKVRILDPQMEMVSAVRSVNADVLGSKDDYLNKMDQIAIRTLQNCMQDVFEDGPKRDRRLWLGDLRIQALVNYGTFHETDLVKRCLYLFAGLTRKDGMIAACIFTENELVMDDTFLLDYSLLFIPTLLEFYKETQDRCCLEELSTIALKQLELAKKFVGEDMVMKPQGDYYCFIDWNEELDKRCAMQGVYLFCLKNAIELCSLLQKIELAGKLRTEYEEMSKKTWDYFWDKKEKVFVSGELKQISMASQVWMIEAGMISGEDAASLIEKVSTDDLKMVTPYMNHYFTEALFLCGKNKKAIEHMKSYWGGMMDMGADTFWELFNPGNLEESPYGSSIINSYCHAWSCSPSYLLRKYN